MKAFYRNKTILITGAASGIGRTFAEQVSRFGVTLILWDRNCDSLRSIRSTLHENTECLISEIDVTDGEAIESEADQLIKSRFVPDIIVNCAGIVVGTHFQNHTTEEIRSILNVNTIGSMLVTHAFLPEMIQRQSGRIVNLASAAGYLGNPGMSVYAASKWAVIGWSESLHLELKQQKTGVGVTCVIPGYVDTGMFEGVKPPRMTPMMDPGVLVQKMMKGIRKGRFKIEAPFMVRITPLLRSVLPRSVFDWFAGRVLLVYESMSTFKGGRPYNDSPISESDHSEMNLRKRL